MSTNPTQAALDKLTTEVDSLTTVNDGVVTLLTRLSDLLRTNASNPAAINAIADRIKTESTKIAESVVSNTPAE